MEGEVAQLRRQGEQQRSEVQGLEEMIRRLLERQSDLTRKLESVGINVPVESNEWSSFESTRLAPLLSRRKNSDSNTITSNNNNSSDNNALGLSTESESTISSSSSSSIATPRSPSFLSPDTTRSRSTSTNTSLPSSTANYQIRPTHLYSNSNPSSSTT